MQLDGQTWVRGCLKKLHRNLQPGSDLFSINSNVLSPMATSSRHLQRGAQVLEEKDAPTPNLPKGVPELGETLPSEGGRTHSHIPPGQLPILVLTLSAHGTAQATQSLHNQVKKERCVQSLVAAQRFRPVEMSGGKMGQIIFCKVQNSRPCKAECEIISVLC